MTKNINITNMNVIKIIAKSIIIITLFFSSSVCNTSVFNTSVFNINANAGDNNKSSVSSDITKKNIKTIEEMKSIEELAIFMQTRSKQEIQDVLENLPITDEHKQRIKRSKTKKYHNLENDNLQSIYPTKEDKAKMPAKLYKKTMNSYDNLIAKAEAGDSEFQFLLAILLQRKNSYRTAAIWMEKAAKNGHKTAQTLHNPQDPMLAAKYAMKRGYKDKARMHFLKAANEDNNNHAQFMLGVLARQNNNDELALSWFEKAALNGNVRARAALKLRMMFKDFIPENH